MTTDLTLQPQRVAASAARGGAPHRARRGVLLHRSARVAARCGYFVFPVAPLGKVPALKDVNWAEIATRDPATLARWWGTAPYNVGIVTGSRSGIVVVDLDTSQGDAPPPDWHGMHHGLDVLARLAERAGGDLPATFTVTTPTHGQHLYYRPPPGVELRNTQSRIGWLVDTRGEGGYVVGAGSVRPEGRYRVARAAPIADLPGWLVQSWTAAPPRPDPPAGSPPRPLTNLDAYRRSIVDQETARVRDARPHTRHQALLSAALCLGNLVGGGELDEQSVYQLLVDAGTAHIGQGQRCDCTPNQVGRTVRWGIDQGRRRPRTL